MLQLEEAGSEAWIAAKFGHELPNEFVLGDGSGTGDYVNRPLSNGKAYKVFVRAYTTPVSLFRMCIGIKIWDAPGN